MIAIQVDNLAKSTLVGHNNAKAESYTAPVCHSEAAIAAEESRTTSTGQAVLGRGPWVEILRFTQDDTKDGGAPEYKGTCHSEAAIAAEESQAMGTTALRDVLARNAKNLARKTRDRLTGRQIVQGDEVEEFWALKDVSFEIQPGDRVGSIGRKGAGKFTGLNILSRITEPTTGRVTINGRVASLLEVGTSFHPELTDRENIFLNGAILGMSRREIQTVGWAKAKAVPNKPNGGGLRLTIAPMAAGSIRPHKSTSIPAIGQANVGSAGLTRCSNPASGLDAAMSEWPATGS